MLIISVAQTIANAMNLSAKHVLNSSTTVSVLVVVLHLILFVVMVVADQNVVMIKVSVDHAKLVQTELVKMNV